MVLVTYENCSYVYITNAINKIYYIVPGTESGFQQTGWHFIPNQQYQNWLTPRQWFDLTTNHDKFRLESCECTVQNMIPLTDNLAIGQDTTFMTFNNTIYALGYTDHNYETALVESGFSNLYREGFTVNIQDGTINAKNTLPLYNHPIAKDGTNFYNVYAWDPFIHPSSLMELRPGKNAIKFSWKRDAADADTWFSTGSCLATSLSDDTTNESKLAFFRPNFATQWMCRGQRWKRDPRNPATANKQINIYDQMWHKPITNWFIKMIPIVGTNKQLLKHEAQVVLVRKITFDVTPRTNTTNFPQVNYTFVDLSKVRGPIASTGLLNPALSTAVRPIEHIGVPPPSDSMDSTQYCPPPATITDPPDEDKDSKENMLPPKFVPRRK